MTIQGTTIHCDGGASADGACESFVVLDVGTPGAPEAQMFALSREGWAFDPSGDWCPAHNGNRVGLELISRTRIWHRLQDTKEKRP